MRNKRIKSNKNEQRFNNEKCVARQNKKQRHTFKWKKLQIYGHSLEFTTTNNMHRAFLFQVGDLVWLVVNESPDWAINSCWFSFNKLLLIQFIFMVYAALFASPDSLPFACTVHISRSNWRCCFAINAIFVLLFSFSFACTFILIYYNFNVG